MQVKEKLNGVIPMLGAIVVFLVCIFCLGSNYGLSDNGDFERIMKVNRLRYIDDCDKSFIVKMDYYMELNGDSLVENIFSTWDTDMKEFYYSPHCIFIKIAKTISYLYNLLSGDVENIFHLEILGIIYIVIFSLASYGILSYFDTLKLRIITLIILLVVFCDMGYILYFNSLYGEALQFVCVMLIIASFLHMQKSNSLFYFFLCLVSTYFLAGAKLANIPYSIVILVGAGFLMRKRPRLWILVVINIFLIFSLFSYIPEWMSHDNNYQAVFFGILNNSESVAQDLKELGLPKEYTVLKNTHAYMNQYPIDINSEEFQENFFDEINKVDIVLFYMRHPIRLLKYFSKAISYSGSIRPVYLGNTVYNRFEVTSRYSLWSHLRLETRFLYNPIFIFCLIGVVTILDINMFIYCIKKRKITDIFIMLVVLTIGICANLLIPVAGNGDADLAKHMFFFTNLIDIIFFSGVIWLINRMSKYNFVFLILSINMVSFITVCLMNASEQIINFGGYEWTVISQTKETKTLVCNDVIGYRAFDMSSEYGSNVWVNSDLRKWLNAELFPVEIQQQIIPVSNSICLNGNASNYFEKGIHPHYWTHSGDYVASFYDESYQMNVVDKVFLPTLNMYQEGKLKRDINEDYWLCEPYTNNESMVRYVDKFGQVLHKDATKELGIRPVITISN